MATLEQLKAKYASVLQVIQEQGIDLRNVHQLQDGKLFIKGVAPSEAAGNTVWDEIKRVDPSYSDLTADIRVEQADRTQTAGAAVGGGQQNQTYTVKPGDTLSKLSQQFYGEANQYMRIFEANRDQLTDPNKIRVGQKLNIPG